MTTLCKSDALNKLTPEQRQQFLDAVQNYEQAKSNYVKDKKAFAEELTNAAITVAVVGSGFLTGFTSTEAYYALVGTAAIAGATFKLEATRQIEGTDFDKSAKNVLSLLLKGGGEATLGLIIPPEIGMAKIGTQVTEQSTKEIIESLGTKFADISLKGGTKGLEKNLTENWQIYLELRRSEMNAPTTN